jgi:hypothetical protein
LIGKPEERDIDVVDRIILRWILDKSVEVKGLYEPVEGSCEHDNKVSGSTKYWEIL